MSGRIIAGAVLVLVVVVGGLAGGDSETRGRPPSVTVVAGTGTPSA